MISIVHELRKASGRNAKLKILQQHKDNQEWKSVLKAMYDSSINYYVSAPKDLSFVSEPTPVNEMLRDLLFLTTRRVTGNTARDHAKYMSGRYGEIVRLILGRSLKAGVSVTTINKAYLDLIPTFEVMLAKKDENPKLPVWAFTKYDGVRVVVVVSNDSVTAYTRSGKELYISSLYTDMWKQGVGAYDGELVKGDGLQSGRTAITGDVNSILKGDATDIADYTFCIFDKLTIEEWESQTCTRSYYDRLQGVFEGFSPTNCTKLCAPEVLKTLDEVEEHYRNLRSKGYEGSILRYPEDVYEWKRTPKLLKMKSTKSCVLKCVSVLKGKGKYEGMVGALHCEGLVEGKTVVVKLGTGFSDFDRDRGEDYYLHQLIDAEYNDIVLAEGADYHSLFLPVYKRIKGEMDT